MILTMSSPQPPPEGKPRPPRRKCILLLSYSGKGYLGMQRNPGVPTIEEELLAALVKSGAVSEDCGDNLGKVGLREGVQSSIFIARFSAQMEEKIFGHFIFHGAFSHVL